MALHDFEITEDSIKIDGRDLVVKKIVTTVEANTYPLVEIYTYANQIATKVEGQLSLNIETYTDREMVEFGEIVRRNTVRENPNSDIEFAEMGLKIVAKFVEMFKAE